MLCHLAAAAGVRLGREAEAKRLWQRALKLQPGHALAAKGLADLRRPAHERHGPSLLPLGFWVSPETLQEMVDLMEKPAQHEDEVALTRAARRYLDQRPDIAQLAPALLEHGDETARDFVITLARLSEAPELLPALRDFALSQHGPDQVRLEASRVASEAGFMATGQTRMWMRGQWVDSLLFGVQIDGEPTYIHSPQVQELAEQAIEALHAGKALLAEEVLKQALALEPGATDLLNNLGAAYQQQGRLEEREALVRQVFDRDPDYLFARAGMADLARRHGDTKGAHALLEPLFQRRRMHFSEFRVFCSALIELCMAEDNLEAARSWLQMWQAIDPDSTLLQTYRLRLSTTGTAVQRIRNLLKPGGRRTRRGGA
jgi:tetratricopeptide (TPR) repeat protein